MKKNLLLLTATMFALALGTTTAQTTKVLLSDYYGASFIFTQTNDSTTEITCDCYGAGELKITGAYTYCNGIQVFTTELGTFRFPGSCSDINNSTEHLPTLYVHVENITEQLQYVNLKDTVMYLSENLYSSASNILINHSRISIPYEKNTSIVTDSYEKDNWIWFSIDSWNKNDTYIGSKDFKLRLEHGKWLVRSTECPFQNSKEFNDKMASIIQAIESADNKKE